MPYTPTTIVSFVPGDYTPGAENAVRNAVNVINATWNMANEKAYDMNAKIEALADPNTGWLATTAAPHISTTDISDTAVAEPNVTIPTNIDTSHILTEFGDEYAEVANFLAEKFVTFKNTYFPDDTASYSVVEDYIQGAMANPTVGLPATVADQIWEDDRTRITADKVRAQDAVIATFASRRFPLPPDAAASAIIQLEQKAQDEMAESSRKVAILSVEQMRFIVEKAISLRQLAMTDALDYIKSLAIGPQVASQVVGIGYDAQSKLINSASSFFGARIEAGKLAQSTKTFNKGNELQVSEKNQAADLAMIENRVKALLMEIQAIAQMSTSMFNNLHASAGTGYNVSVS